MSKLLPALTGVACFLWVSGWTWIISDGKQATNNRSNQMPTQVFLDSMQYEVQHPFAFEYGDATPIIAENLLPAIKSINKKLAAKQINGLKIIGIYSPMEKNETSFPNLGLARAESVKAILLAGGATEDKFETIGLETANLFKTGGKLTGAIYFSFSEQGIESRPVADDAQKDDEKETGDEDEELGPATGAASFYYKYGDYKVEKHHVPFLKSLVKTLKNQPGTRLLLTGYSGVEEETESSSINLAELRALAIRRYLVDHGVRRAQIDVNAKPSMARTSKEMVVSIQLKND
jgi:OmpA-OmpF porin, OOP family